MKTSLTSCLKHVKAQLSFPLAIEDLDDKHGKLTEEHEELKKKLTELACDLLEEP